MSEFARIITLLRNERHLTQKQAAVDLGISQALLSHYERGARECGLDFLVKTADYYGVSCDYLLGRTPDRNGASITAEEIPDPEGDPKSNRLHGSAMVMLNKKLICNSLNILYDLLQAAGSSSMTNEVSGYLMLAVYKMFRSVYSANPKNPQSIFSVGGTYSYDSTASMLKAEGVISSIVTGRPGEGVRKIEDLEAILTSEESITKAYPQLAQSLLTVIRYAEQRIN